MTQQTTLYLTLPVLNELDNLPQLIENLRHQEYLHFHLVVCINHYENWRSLPEKQLLITNNEQSIKYLSQITDFPITIIDRASINLGWPQKKGGVGWARKVTMETALQLAKPTDIIVSIDADTMYPPNYLREIKISLEQNNKAVGLAIPYYHPLNGDSTDRLILRYELYMRHYAINMLLIKNPYAFSALGSAMAFPVWAYKKAGGITPVQSGEDFYFLQKLAKLGPLVIWSNTTAYPSPRFSDRVIFGTGPALIKGNTGNWSSYPIYHPKHFAKIATTYNSFSNLFTKNFPTPMDEFLFERFNTTQIWEPLRKNFKHEFNFIRACTAKIDGLRILQFLREQHATYFLPDEQIFLETYRHEWPSLFSDNVVSQLNTSGFNGLTIPQLNSFRLKLMEKENLLRQKKIINSL